MDAAPARTLAARFQLWLAVAYLAAAGAVVVLVNLHDRRAALQEAQRKAHLLLDRNLAIHRYFDRELKPAVLGTLAGAREARFDSRWMSPTYAVRRIDETAREEGTASQDLHYKEAAIDARSPASEADAVERAFLEDARRDPTLEIRTFERLVDGRVYLEVLHRGETVDRSCLRCHSDPAAAPPGLVERYGALRALDRQPGELASAISVRVPLDDAYAAANAFSLRLSLALVGVLAALYGVQLVFQRRLVFAPITRLRAEVARLSQRHPGFDPVELPPHPELRELTEAFNRMGEAVGRNREQLEQLVAERTEALVRAGRELERAAREREHARKVEALGRLAGGVAHDFNNLLTTIHGYANLLVDGLPEGDPRREDVFEIQRAANRATALTRQLLAFSRRDVVTPRVLDPNEVVGQLEGMLRRLIRENVRLELDLAPGAGPVRADPGQLEQIVLNLAVNARDAMPDGGRLSIRTRNVVIPGSDAPPDPLPDGRWLMLSVEDSGVGMDPETLANAFEPFFPTRGRDVGAGLGLATVQAVARQCGGSVVAESAPGQGSLFRVWLPVVDGAPEALDHLRASAAAAAPPGAAVLVAEDDAPVRRLVCSVLRQGGYGVHEATDGAEALAFLDRPGAPRVDVLIADLVMPGLDGRALAARARERRPGLHVLFITGYAPGDDRGDRTDPAGDACLLKPFAPGALLSAVGRLVDAARAGAP